MLSVNRLDRAKRIDLLLEAAKTEPSLRIVIAGEGPDRERLEQPGLRPERAGRVRRPRRRRDGSPTSTRAASPSTTRLSTRTSGWSRTRRSSRASRSLTTTDAGGPLEVVADRQTGVVVAPDAGFARARRCAYLGANAAEAAAFGLAGKAVAERVTWDACIDALLS